MGTMCEVRRSTTDAKIGGVCGGIAEHVGVDPLLIRVVAVILALSSGIGVGLYVTAWASIPERGQHESLAAQRIPALRSMSSRAWIVVGLALAGGIGTLLAPVIPFGIWPAIVVVGAIHLGKKQARKAQLEQRQREALTPAPSEFDELARQWQARIAQTRGLTDPQLPLPYISTAPTFVDATTTSTKTHWQGWRLLLPALALSGTMATVLGILKMKASLDISNATIGLAFFLPLALGVIATAFLGKSKMTLAFAICLLLSCCAQVSVSIAGNEAVGAVIRTYASGSELPATITSNTGPLSIDMGALTLTEDHTIAITHDVGPVDITVSDDIHVVIEYSVGVGPFQAPDKKKAGIGTSGRWESTTTQGPTLTLVVSNDVGPVTIHVR